MYAIINNLGLDIVTALFVGGVFGLLWGVIITLILVLFTDELLAIIRGPWKVAAWLYRCLASRERRRQRTLNPDSTPIKGAIES